MIQNSYDNSPSLYLIPTPIGNLDDMTYRAVKVLEEVEVIFSEDTRVTLNLLNNFGIKKKLISLHDHNEDILKEKVLEYLKNGKSVGLVTDRGTPIISDPGYKTVKYISDNNYNVIALPGATAFVPALVASGLPDERFCFEGFLPQKKGRVTRLTSLQEEKRTMIFYESPYRLVKTLTQFAEFFGAERPVSVCREISKIHEESVRGTLTEVIAHFTQNEPRGEIVIVLGGKED